jgi:membrane-associated phospholipid phosphatase
MKKFFKRDNFIFGIIIGAIFPLILFAILYYLNELCGNIFLHIPFILQTSTIQLIAIVVNVFMMRHYLVKLKYDKTGRGVLLLTFVYIIAYFVNEFLIK